MKYSLILAVIAAAIAVVSAGRLNKRPLMYGHSWKMPKSVGDDARVHIHEVENFKELANAFIDNSVAEMGSVE